MQQQPRVPQSTSPDITYSANASDEDWRIPEFAWDEGLSTWQTIKAMNEKQSKAVIFSSFGVLFTLPAMFLGFKSVALFYDVAMYAPLIVLVMVFVAGIYSSISGTHQSNAHWHTVNAKILDLEMKEPRQESYQDAKGRTRYRNWVPLRLHCVYHDAQGQEIHCLANPEYSISSHSAVHDWVAKNSQNNVCQLLVHPDFPRLTKLGVVVKKVSPVLTYMVASFVLAAVVSVTLVIVTGNYEFFWTEK